MPEETGSNGLVVASTDNGKTNSDGKSIDNKGKTTDKKRKETCCEWVKSPTFAIYLNYFLSAWGDRMWHFAVGLYLVYLADGVLRLTAIFGFTGGILMLIFGGIIGNWVDKNGRLKVVVISLFVQNLSVALCAVTLCLSLVYEAEIAVGLSGRLHCVTEAAIIGLALVAYVASMAYKIAIEKDWIVVVAGGNSNQLSKLNAVTRALDLTCKILSPTVAGIVMSYSHVVAAICIAGWNILSVVCEYFLLRRVYKLVPELATKGARRDNSDVDKGSKLEDIIVADKLEKPNLPSLDISKPTAQPEEEEGLLADQTPESPDLAGPEKSLETANGHVSGSRASVRASRPSVREKSCLRMAAEPFVTLVKGWKTYARQRVVFAGLSLSLLYMTVLGFDSVTLGYIYANGVKESYVGMTMGVAGVTGILGTFIFTRINRRLGLARTGLIAYSLEIGFLTLAVASVWAPGTLFDPTFDKHSANCTLLTPRSAVANGTLLNDTLSRTRRSAEVFDCSMLRFTADGLENENPAMWAVVPAVYGQNGGGQNGGGQVIQRSRRDVGNDTAATLWEGEEGRGCPPPQEGVTMSIVFFLVGIVASRVGLWMADLVVTQIVQESVDEMERGIVNGVQNSLNMLNDMIKFALVIFFPHIQTFGILICLSFTFICAAGGLFAAHVCRTEPRVLRCNHGDDSPPSLDSKVIKVTEVKV